MSLNKLLERDLICCPPEATVAEAARLMDEHNVGAIVVVDASRFLAGILTDRDIVVRCIGKGTNCEEAKVAEIMTTKIASVKTTDGIFDVVRTMKENAVRRVPVLDESGVVVGLLSFGDIFHLLGTEFRDLAAIVEPESPKIVAKQAA